jgi:GT2 family glycosyltransferase
VTMPRLATVIVTFNSAATLPACLRALRDSAPAAGQEIVVVDNASEDGTADLVARDWPQVRLLRLARNLGFAAGNNAGIRATAGDRLLLVNPDAVLTPGALDTLMAALDRDPSVAIAGPRIVDAGGRTELSFGPMISPFAEAWQKLRVRGLERAWPLIGAAVERQTQRPGYPAWVSGACWLARRAPLEAAGLFDERFFLYTEDVDLCARVRSAGHRVAFVPDAVVRHTRGASRATVRDAADMHYRRSQVAFYEKHHPRWAPLLRAYLMAKGALPDTTKQRS